MLYKNNGRLLKFIDKLKDNLKNVFAYAVAANKGAYKGHYGIMNTWKYRCHHQRPKHMRHL